MLALSLIFGQLDCEICTSQCRNNSNSGHAPLQHDTFSSSNLRRAQQANCDSSFVSYAKALFESAANSGDATYVCTWAVHDWGICRDRNSAANAVPAPYCGSDGVHDRQVLCGGPLCNSAFGSRDDPSVCGQHVAKPETSESCEDTSGCDWVAGAWSACSNTCGQGTKARAVQCSTGSESDCVKAGNLWNKPAKDSECTDFSSCTWIYTPWSSCSQQCGSGLTTRLAKCSSGRDSDCQGAQEATSATCVGRNGCQFQPAAWGACSSTCGPGVRSRSAPCVASDGTAVSDSSLCLAENVLPQTTVDCVECSGCQWSTNPEWSVCSSQCGKGIQTAVIECAGAAYGCPCANAPPSDTRECTSYVDCSWEAGGWSQCSTSCGDGTRTRLVWCSSGDDANCVAGVKPASQESCRQVAGCDWIASAWNACDATCGSGEHTRQVSCADASGQAASESLCDMKPDASKPATSEVCRSCEGCGWTENAWSSCSSDCGEGIQVRDVQCSCPWESVTNGDDALHCPIKTKFWCRPRQSIYQTICDNMNSMEPDRAEEVCRKLTSFCSWDEEPAKPADSQRCEDYTGCGWAVGAWGTCANTCGNGERTRDVWCTSGNDTICETHVTAVLTSLDRIAVETVSVGSRTIITTSSPHLYETSDLVSLAGFPASAQLTALEGSLLAVTVISETEFSLGVDTVAASDFQHQDLVVPPTVGQNIISVQGAAVTDGAAVTFMGSSTSPTGLSNGNVFYAIRVADNKMKLYHDDARTQPVLFQQLDELGAGSIFSWARAPKPATAEQCQDFAECSYDVGEWTPCSATCGDGERKRAVACKDTANPPNTVNEEWCSSTSRARPAEVETCRSCASCPYSVGEWSGCSTTCGAGVSSRDISCDCPHAADLGCPANTVSSKKVCSDFSGCGWQTGGWSACSVDCGTGERRREVWCASGEEASCDSASKPPSSVLCRSVDGCNYDIGQWGPCDETCGAGHRSRSVVCSKPEDSTRIPVRFVATIPQANANGGVNQAQCSLQITVTDGSGQLVQWTSQAAVTRDSALDLSGADSGGDSVPAATVGQITGAVTVSVQASNSLVNGGTCELRSLKFGHTDLQGMVLQGPIAAAWVDSTLVFTFSGTGTHTASASIEVSDISGLWMDLCLDKGSAPASTEECKSCNGCVYTVDPWSDCSASCGLGQQTRVTNCTCPYLAEGMNCLSPTPATAQTCQGTSSCQWVEGEWGPCDTSCGEGERIRQVWCSSGSDADCPPTKPDVRETCRSTEGCGWSISKWSLCSTDCGEGTRTRAVECRDSAGALKDEAECVASGVKPPSSEVCSSCAGCSHTIGDWSTCGSSCSSGVQERTVTCQCPADLAAANPCTPTSIATTRNCWSMTGCTFQVDEWSSCSSSCGPGRQARNTWCGADNSPTAVARRLQPRLLAASDTAVVTTVDMQEIDALVPGNPTTVLKASHGLGDGGSVTFRGIASGSAPGFVALNDQTYIVTRVGVDEFTVPVDTSGVAAASTTVEQILVPIALGGKSYRLSDGADLYASPGGSTAADLVAALQGSSDYATMPYEVSASAEVVTVTFKVITTVPPPVLSDALGWEQVGVVAPGAADYTFNIDLTGASLTAGEHYRLSSAVAVQVETEESSSPSLLIEQLRLAALSASMPFAVSEVAVDNVAALRLTYAVGTKQPVTRATLKTHSRPIDVAQKIPVGAFGSGVVVVSGKEHADGATVVFTGHSKKLVSGDSYVVRWDSGVPTRLLVESSAGDPVNFDLPTDIEDGDFVVPCDGQTQPDQDKPCTGSDGCGWQVGRWSQCSESCGSGERTRLVRCAGPDDQAVRLSQVSKSDAPGSPTTVTSVQLTEGSTVARVSLSQSWMTGDRVILAGITGYSDSFLGVLNREHEIVVTSAEEFTVTLSMAPPADAASLLIPGGSVTASRTAYTEFTSASHPFNSGDYVLLQNVEVGVSQIGAKDLNAGGLSVHSVSPRVVFIDLDTSANPSIAVTSESRVSRWSPIAKVVVGTTTQITAVKHGFRDGMEVEISGLVPHAPTAAGCPDADGLTGKFVVQNSQVDAFDIAVDTASCTMVVAPGAAAASGERYAGAQVRVEVQVTGVAKGATTQLTSVADHQFLAGDVVEVAGIDVGVSTTTPDMVSTILRVREATGNTFTVPVNTFLNPSLSTPSGATAARVYFVASVAKGVQTLVTIAQHRIATGSTVVFSGLEVPGDATATIALNGPHTVEARGVNVLSFDFDSSALTVSTTEGAQAFVVADSTLCLGTPPATMESCASCDSCPYTAAEWGSCSNTCGQGVRQRGVACQCDAALGIQCPVVRVKTCQYEAIDSVVCSPSEVECPSSITPSLDDSVRATFTGIDGASMAIVTIGKDFPSGSRVYANQLVLSTPSPLHLRDQGVYFVERLEDNKIDLYVHASKADGGSKVVLTDGSIVSGFFVDVPVLTVVSVSPSFDTIARGGADLPTGTKVVFQGESLDPLVVPKGEYFVVREDASSITLYTGATKANDGTKVDITVGTVSGMFVPLSWDGCPESPVDGKRYHHFENCRTVLQSNEVCVDETTPPIPMAQENCTDFTLCGWKTGDWGSCSETCGQGVRNRDVWCESGDDADCDGAAKPDSTTACVSNSECMFDVSDWDACNNSCGYGFHSRSVACTRFDREPRDMAYCTGALADGVAAPPETESCGSCSGCGWIVAAAWGPCSSGCGAGTQTRSVECSCPVEGLSCPMEVDTVCEAVDPGSKAFCDEHSQICDRLQGACYPKTYPAARLSDTQTCTGTGVCHWHVSGWGSCSATCGVGVRTRTAWCSSGDASQCSDDAKPATETSCDSTDACTFQLGAWDICRSPTGSDLLCGEGIRVREVSCRAGDTQLSLVQKLAVTVGGGGQEYVLSTGVSITSAPLAGSTREDLVTAIVGTDFYHDLPFTVAEVDSKIQIRYKMPGVVATMSRLTPSGGSPQAAVRKSAGSADAVEVQEFVITSAETLAYTLDDGAVVTAVIGAGSGLAALVTAIQGDSSGAYSSLPFTVAAPDSELVLTYKTEYPRFVTFRAVLENAGTALTATSEESMCTSRMVKPAQQESCRACSACAWEPSDWGACSDTCGTGKRSRDLICTCPYEELSCPGTDPEGNPVVDTLPRESACTVHSSCDWTVGPWSSCSSECGQGVRTRLITCPSGDDANCLVQNPKLPTSETCQSCNHCSFVISDWGECDATCGEGAQTRTASCPSGCADSFCEARRTAALELTRPCFGYQSCAWHAAVSWGSCSTECGTGYQTRDVSCVRPDGTETENAFCGKLDTARPAEVQACTSRSGCSCAEMQDSIDMCEEESSKNLWTSLTTKLADCAVECAKGLQRADSGGLDCNVNFGWHSRPWRSCSTQCGIGVQYRHVFCPTGNAADCAWQSKPTHQRRCLDTSQCVVSRRLRMLQAASPSLLETLGSRVNFPDEVIHGNVTLSIDEIWNLLEEGQARSSDPTQLTMSIQVAAIPARGHSLMQWLPAMLPDVRRVFASFLGLETQSVTVEAVTFDETAGSAGRAGSATLSLKIVLPHIFVLHRALQAAVLWQHNPELIGHILDDATHHSSLPPRSSWVAQEVTGAFLSRGPGLRPIAAIDAARELFELSVSEDLSSIHGRFFIRLRFECLTGGAGANASFVAEADSSSHRTQAAVQMLVVLSEALSVVDDFSVSVTSYDNDVAFLIKLSDALEVAQQVYQRVTRAGHQAIRLLDYVEDFPVEV